MTDPGAGLVLGYDFGTSTVKAALFHRDGTAVARASVPYPLSIPEPGWAEQDPAHWWDAMREVTTRVLGAANTDGTEIKAIGICAQMCGVVIVDENGAAIGKCLTWLDTRSAPIARQAFGGLVTILGYGVFKLARWLRLTGGAPSLLGRDATSKILWLREKSPEQWRRTDKILDAKDYLVMRCTERAVTSFDCAHLTWIFDARPGRKCWSKTLLRQFGLKEEIFPQVASATDVAGGLAPQAAKALGLSAGTPMAVGLGDASAAALGSGAVAEGVPHLCVGTGAWLGAHVTRSKVSPLAGFGSICRADGEGYFLIASQENAGGCIIWASEALGFGEDYHAAFEQSASASVPSLDAPMFMPWLFGERVPVQDEHVRGGFLNVSAKHTRNDMARAVYEGVALNIRWAMRDFDRLAGSAGTPLRFVGGGGTSSLWCQIFADVLQRPIELVVDPDLGGARGAAMTAAIAAGWYDNISDAATMTKVARVYGPNADMADHYAARFVRFSASYKRLKSWYRDA